MKIGAYALGAAVGGWVVPAVGPLTAIAVIAGLQLAAAGLGHLAAREPEPAASTTLASTPAAPAEAVAAEA